jgi:hypothetical protein
MMTDVEADGVFNSLVEIKVGDGAKTLFWTDRWWNGRAISEIAPLVVASVSLAKKKRRTVRETLQDHAWVGDVPTSIGAEGVGQCVRIWQAVNVINLDDAQEDVIAWPWSASGVYTASSTYRMLCVGSVKWEGVTYVWKSSAPLKCKIFAWLALQGKLWTSDRRVRHGLQDVVSTCYTCLQEVDTVRHVLVGCVYARQVWHRCFMLMGMEVPMPTETDNLQDWWALARKRFRRKEKKGFDSFIILIAWRIWKQRNARIFDNVARQFSEVQLVEQIVEEWDLWAKASLGGCNLFARVVH